ncbi:MAG: MGMT family protein [Candidatus Omnitrophica bacterium]|nr:MGMT family protein [Candidatus Omnitrophota bacterium]
MPCHRIICSDGSLGGYAKGIKVKERLLKKEKAI